MHVSVYKIRMSVYGTDVSESKYGCVCKYDVALLVDMQLIELGTPTVVVGFELRSAYICTSMNVDKVIYPARCTVLNVGMLALPSVYLRTFEFLQRGYHGTCIHVIFLVTL